MKNVNVRNIVIGEGIPKICVPIVGCNQEELIAEVEALKDVPVDIVEWRMDWFDDILDVNKALNMLQKLRDTLVDLPILATFRSKQEGGEKEIDSEYYVTLNKAIAKSGLADMLDVELFTGEDEVNEIVNYAHEHGVFIVMSNHDFHKTPSYDQIITRLKAMQNLNADIPKIAVMPKTTGDVLTLLSATNDMTELYADRPIITMSMAGKGVISRLSGEVFGSCLTFGAAKKASAPGQMAVQDLKVILELLHNSVK